MRVANTSSVSALQISAKVQVCDLRSKHRSAACREVSAHSRSRCVRIQSQAQLRSQSSISRRQLNGHLICNPTARRCSASSGPKIAASFQSHTPVQQSQQIQAPISGPKFQPFTPQNGVRQDLLNYRHKVKVANGSVLVRPLTHAWVHDCGGLLTGAFADAMGYVPMYRTYLRHQIRQYLYRHADMPPKAIVLVALLIPETASDSQDSCTSQETSNSDAEPEASISRQDPEASTSGQEQEQGAILVGTVELSFAASTRARYLTLNAPVNCAYLCNMAVDANYRRRGYGNILLDAADDVAKLAGETQIYLHLRFQDAAPASLYKQAGYVSDKADSFLVRLLGLDRRYLMKKQHQ